MQATQREIQATMQETQLLVQSQETQLLVQSIDRSWRSGDAGEGTDG